MIVEVTVLVDSFPYMELMATSNIWTFKLMRGYIGLPTSRYVEILDANGDENIPS